MKFIVRTFLTGLVTVLPVAATFYVVVWLFVTTETVLGDLLRPFVPSRFYWPGLGVAAVVVMIFVVGLIMRSWVAQKLFEWAEALLYRTPVVKSVYGPLRDFFSFLAEPKQKGLQKVVIVTFGKDPEMHLVGFVTREDLQNLPEGIDRGDRIAVYLPMSYMVGGYMVLVPRSAVRPVDMSLEDAMRLTLTAGLSAKARK